MRMCSECGLRGDRLYENGHTTLARCPLHPRARLYQIERGRVLWRDLGQWNHALRRPQ